MDDFHAPIPGTAPNHGTSIPTSLHPRYIAEINAYYTAKAITLPDHHFLNKIMSSNRISNNLNSLTESLRFTKFLTAKTTQQVE